MEATGLQCTTLPMVHIAIIAALGRLRQDDHEVKGQD